MTVGCTRKDLMKIVSREFGVRMEPTAVTYLLSTLEQQHLRDPEEVEQSVKTILEQLLLTDGDTEIITQKALQDTVQKFLQRAEMFAEASASSSRAQTSVVNALEHFHVISSLDTTQFPRLTFDRQRNKFHELVDAKDYGAKVLATPQRKAEIFRDRFDLIRQRIARNPNFRQPSHTRHTTSLDGEALASNYMKITPIKNLLGCHGQQFLLFGMLAALKHGVWFLEDLDADVEIDLSDLPTSSHSEGIYTEGCFVLLFGEYTAENKFIAAEISMPPPETRALSNAAHRMVNFFGGPRDLDDMQDVKELESEPDQHIVIVSDLWLDKSAVLEKIKSMLSGYQEAGVVPVAFIFMGDFTSEPFAYNGSSSPKYRDSFRALADIIAEFPDVKHTNFVFIPGPNDPWGDSILPRPPIPKSLTEAVQRKVPRAIFSTNPCRIKYCSRELVIVRDDLLAKMQRNAVIKPNMVLSGSLSFHLFSTLLQQSYLRPLPLHLAPVYWGFEHSLRIYPNPHGLILGDRHDPSEMTIADTVCMNPGAFGSNGFQYMVYYPADQRAEISQIE